MTQQRVLVVDDHRIFGQLLASALSGESDLVCVGTAHDTSSAMTMTAELAPDIVVMDVRLGDGDGIAAADTLTRSFPALRVVVLTAFADTRLAQRAAEAGASALVAKDGELGNLLQAIRTCSRGTFAVQEDLLGPKPEHAATSGPPALSDRHRAALRLLAAGFEAPAIARELGVPTAEASALLDEIVVTLGVETRLEAVALAISTGLLRVSPA